MLVGLHCWRDEFNQKIKYLNNIYFKTCIREQNQILDYLPDGAIIFKIDSKQKDDALNTSNDKT